jgi:hypothetical protein
MWLSLQEPGRLTRLTKPLVLNSILRMFNKLTLITISKSQPVINHMETKMAGKTSGGISELMAMVTLFLLSDYFRFRLHDWGKISNPLSGALGFLLSSTIVFLVWGTGPRPRLTKRTSVIVVISLSLAIYIIGRLFHF